MCLNSQADGVCEMNLLNDASVVRESKHVLSGGGERGYRMTFGDEHVYVKDRAAAVFMFRAKLPFGMAGTGAFYPDTGPFTTSFSV